jgi:ubiquinone biosynthesis protein UbiJ
MAGDPLFTPLEALLNRNIAASSKARTALARLAGRSLEVRVSATPMKIRFAAGESAVAVSDGGEGEPDAVIEGTPLALATLAGPDAEDRIRAGSVRISGDAETAQSFQKLFEAARPDFEEELSRLTGDVAAHHLANAARDALEFGRRAFGTLARNMGEYLTEESRDLPARPEVEAWIEAVDSLREDADRLEARLERLERVPREDGA